MIHEVSSLQNLREELTTANQAFLLLYKKDSGQSECAYTEFAKAAQQLKQVKALTADVTQVKDIHPAYMVSTVPTLIEFENGKFKNITKGCQTQSYLLSLMKKNFFTSAKGDDKAQQKNVTVYSTPTCSWCNTLKRYLDEKKINYIDIDISNNQKKAEEMMKKSGQQGVPQTDINGTMIVGFDKNRIDKLLDITNS